MGGRTKSIQEEGGLHKNRRVQGFPSDDFAQATPRHSRRGDPLSLRHSTSRAATGAGDDLGLDISIFMKAYVNLTRNLHGRSFCWHKIMRKHRGML